MLPLSTDIATQKELNVVEQSLSNFVHLSGDETLSGPLYLVKKRDDYYIPELSISFKYNPLTYIYEVGQNGGTIDEYVTPNNRLTAFKMDAEGNYLSTKVSSFVCEGPSDYPSLMHWVYGIAIPDASNEDTYWGSYDCSALYIISEKYGDYDNDPWPPLSDWFSPNADATFSAWITQGFEAGDYPCEYPKEGDTVITGWNNISNWFESFQDVYITDAFAISSKVQENIDLISNDLQDFKTKALTSETEPKFTSWKNNFGAISACTDSTHRIRIGVGQPSVMKVNTIGIGYNVNTQNNGLGIGNNVNTNGIAIGNNANVGGIGIGTNVYSNNGYSVAIGTNAKASCDNDLGSIAVGHDANAWPGGISIGAYTGGDAEYTQRWERNSENIAIGYAAGAMAGSGSSAKSRHYGNIVIGNYANRINTFDLSNAIVLGSRVWTGISPNYYKTPQATKSFAIQIGCGTNDEVSSLQVYDWKVLNQNGDIPYARLSSVLAGYTPAHDYVLTITRINDKLSTISNDISCLSDIYELSSEVVDGLSNVVVPKLDTIADLVSAEVIRVDEISANYVPLTAYQTLENRISALESRLSDIETIVDQINGNN